MNYKKSKFSYDGEHVYNGFTSGQTWNGFDCPCFLVSVAKQIVKDMRDSDGTGETNAYFDTVKGVFIVNGDEYKIESIFYNGRFPNVVHLGASAWTWEECK